jgi:hypothetical protein
VVGDFFESATARLRDWSLKHSQEARAARKRAEARASEKETFMKEFEEFRRRKEAQDARLMEVFMEENKAFNPRMMGGGGEGKAGPSKKGRGGGLRRKERAAMLSGWDWPEGGGNGNGGGKGGGKGGGRGKAQAVSDVIDADKVARDWGDVWEERVREFKKDLEAEVVAVDDIDVSFDTLPYPLE